MEEIIRMKGTNGTIIVHEDRIIISRKGFVAFISQGIMGDRNYFYSDLRSIEYKKPSIFANGYIKLIIAGTNDVNASVGILGSTLESSKDPNTIILRAFNSTIPSLSEEVYKIILDKINASNKQINMSQLSPADEILKFKKLLDDNIITQEEFSIKKQELLNN